MKSPCKAAARWLSGVLCLPMLCATGLAATIAVDNSCTLAEAIEAANNDAAVGGCTAGNGGDTLVLSVPNTELHVNVGAFASIVQNGMTVALPPILSEITLEGHGLRIIADASVNAFRVLEFFSASNTRLTLRDVHISGADNGHGSGSALFTLGGNLTLEDCSFSDNRGAVILLETLDSVIRRSVFVDNWNDQDNVNGPALEVIGSSLTLSDSSLINNQVIFSGSDFNLSDAHPAGGLNITSPNSGPIRVINTTISGNSAITGGGIAVRDQHGRQTRGVSAPVELLHNTVVNNSALFVGGVAVHNVNSSVALLNNLIAGNSASQAEGRELWLAETSDLQLDGHNLMSNHTLNPLVGALIGASDQLTLQSLNELVAPLQLQDGLWVHPLRAHSEAIDSGPTPCEVATDALGTPRPQDGDGDLQAHCDAGAIERAEVIFAHGFE